LAINPQGAVTDILKLLPFHQTRLHRQGGRLAFHGLNAGILIAADQMDSGSVQFGSALIQVADFLGLSRQ
jgi:hypothetical protein